MSRPDLRLGIWRTVRSVAEDHRRAAVAAEDPDVVAAAEAVLSDIDLITGPLEAVTSRDG